MLLARCSSTTTLEGVFSFIICRLHQGLCPNTYDTNRRNIVKIRNNTTTKHCCKMRNWSTFYKINFLVWGDFNIEKFSRGKRGLGYILEDVQIVHIFKNCEQIYTSIGTCERVRQYLIKMLVQIMSRVTVERFFKGAKPNTPRLNELWTHSHRHHNSSCLIVPNCCLWEFSC